MSASMQTRASLRALFFSLVSGLVVVGQGAAMAQQPNRTYAPTPRSSGNKAARVGAGPTAGSRAGSKSAPPGINRPSPIAPRGAAKPQIGATAPKGPQMGGGIESSSPLPAGVRLPSQPGQGRYIQPRK